VTPFQTQNGIAGMTKASVSTRRRWYQLAAAILALAFGVIAWGSAAIQSSVATDRRYGSIAIVIGAGAFVVGAVVLGALALSRRSIFLRGRFQFGLRTMFVVVTLFAIWLGWTLWRVRDRESVYAFLTSKKIRSHADVMLPDETPLAPWKQLPLTWRLFGAKPVSLIRLKKARFSEEDRKRIQSRFPEASVTLD
jgi:MFS family permease